MRLSECDVVDRQLSDDEVLLKLHTDWCTRCRQADCLKEGRGEIMLQLTLVVCPHPGRVRELRKILEDVKHRQQLLHDDHLYNKTSTQKQRILSLPFTVMTKFLQELRIQLFEGNMSKVLVLNVWECDSLRTLPAELGRHTSLRTLSIDHCPSLHALPAELGRLQGLRTLSIDHCPSLDALPAELGRLQDLTDLGIKNCPLL